jgi:hypothetical protein
VQHRSDTLSLAIRWRFVACIRVDIIAIRFSSARVGSEWRHERRSKTRCGRPRYFGLRDLHDAVPDGENQCL